MPCCESPDQITNFASDDYVKSLLIDLAKTRQLIKRNSPEVKLVDGMELVCGSGYSLDKAENMARSGWTYYPVHLNVHIYAKMALNLIQKLASGADSAPGPSTANPQGFNQKRKHSGSGDGGPYRSTPRSIGWRYENHFGSGSGWDSSSTGSRHGYRAN